MNGCADLNPDKHYGLSSEQVKMQIQNGAVNIDSSVQTKTISQIVRNNFFTLFNIINFILAIAIIYVGSFKNLLFMGVVLSNIAISTVQEIRAKHTVDKLSIMSETKSTVIRDGKEISIPINDLVLCDIIKLCSGNQIPTDCIIVDGQCDVNESLITGESDSIHKKVGDKLLSGSYIVSGTCKAKVKHVGLENYAAKISKDAKYIKKVNSQIMSAFNKIILILSILIVPIGTFLFFKQLNTTNFNDAVINTVAALIGMIPEGLVLLTSTVLAVSVVRLSKYKVLVQELYCIETLARVDVLCLDKTGTITEGTMSVEDVIPTPSFDKATLEKSISMLISNLEDCNPTCDAIKAVYLKKDSKKADYVVPFSSEKKWSGAFFKEHGSIILGSAEFILKGNISDVKKEISNYAKENRVIMVAFSKYEFKNNNLPDKIVPMGFILLKDTIRKNAKSTLEYFAKQEVDVKVISGDNVLTASNVAKCAGVKNYDNFIDASTLKSYSEIKTAVEQYTVFGRVSPKQKKEMVLALKESGHTVAMTGDGVNDVLALKEADCSIVMANGSDAARNVAQLVLLNSDFASMPKVVLEGRRSINNIQRSSSLFLVKTIYSTLLAIIFLFINMAYPFMPIQMTLTSVLTIGIPSFILALEPNNDRVKGNLFLNIISRALPCSLTIVVSILLIMLFTNFITLDTTQVSTLCVILTGFCGLMLLYRLCFPFNKIRKILFYSMSICFIIGFILFKDFFSLAQLNFKLIILLIIFSLLAYFIFNFFLKIGIEKLIKTDE